MKESIYTIPINEVFEEKRGCPICALQQGLEARWVQYVTGPAMMEPDVRLKTNEEGVCRRHLNAMLGQRNRLSVALLLQTRLEHILKQLEVPSSSLKKKPPRIAGDTCFVCSRVREELARLAGNTAAMWAREASFQALYSQQEHLCLTHYALLTQAGESLRGPLRARFLAETGELLRKGLSPAKADIDAFCRLYDHRSGKEQPPEQVANAVERAGVLICRGTL